MFRLFRTVRGIDIRQAATMLDISAATLSRIERGHTFDAATLLKLWAWLLTEDAPVTAPEVVR